MTTLPRGLSAFAACWVVQVSSALARTQADAQAAVAGPVEVATRAALARIEQLDPTLRSVSALDPAALDEARRLDRQRSARGPLHGLTLVVKDNIETRGTLPTTAGSLALEANVSGRDAPVVARVRAAGAVVIGKANMSVWAYMRSTRAISGWSTVGGQTRNPYALDRNPCGSSSGSAVAVAAGLVDAALGTETDGSITCPAAVSGVVGLKPTLGLISRSGIVPVALSQDTAGPMARDVATFAHLLTAMAGSDAGDPATVEADARRQDYSVGLAAATLRRAAGHAALRPGMVGSGGRGLRARLNAASRAGSGAGGCHRRPGPVGIGDSLHDRAARRVQVAA